MSDEKSRFKLLMVDDEEEFLDSSAPALGQRGFKVHVARDGTGALEMFQNQEFDIVLLDVKMPGLDGVEVFRRMKKQKPDVPVVILTGHGSVPQAFETAKEGIADYLTKPCDINVLSEKLHDAISKAGKDAAAKGRKSFEQLEVIKVLLVDDEIEFFESLKPALERRQMKIFTAASGEKALEIISGSVIDVVVLDIKMPGMDGLEVLRRVKQDKPEIEVILLTGHPSVEAALEGIKQGASEYLTKPSDVEALAATIRKVYHRRLENLEKRRRDLIEEIRDRYPE